MPRLVSPDNFARAESDLYFGGIVRDSGFGALFHNRELSSIDHQIVIRQNRDTLYSAAVFDLDAGPVTVTRFVTRGTIEERIDQVLRDMVARGELGRKSGKGFYDWSKRDPRKRQAEARTKLAEILALLDRQKRTT